MPFIYHLAPSNMKGNTLYPVSILKSKFPNIYRKEIPKTRIPYLNCKWGDVLQFIAVHPSKIRKALRKAGFKNKVKLKRYKINANNLVNKNTIIYSYKDETLKRNNFVKYDLRKLSQYNKLAEKTKKYYSEEFKNGRRPLFFVFVPHILYKDCLNIKNAEIIEI